MVAQTHPGRNESVVATIRQLLENLRSGGAAGCHLIFFADKRHLKIIAHEYLLADFGQVLHQRVEFWCAEIISGFRDGFELMNAVPGFAHGPGRRKISGGDRYGQAMPVVDNHGLKRGTVFLQKAG